MQNGPQPLPKNLFIGPTGLSAAQAAIRSCLRGYLENDRTGWQLKAQSLTEDLQRNPPKDLIALREKLEKFCPTLRAPMKKFLGLQGNSSLKNELEAILSRLPTNEQLDIYEKKIAVIRQNIKIESLQKKLESSSLDETKETKETEVEKTDSIPSPLLIAKEHETSKAKEQRKSASVKMDKAEMPATITMNDEAVAFDEKDPATWEEEDPNKWSAQQKTTFQNLFG